MEDILLGTTDRSILVFVSDSASTTGAGKTALAHSAITVSYTRVETDNDVVVTDVTGSLSALTNLTDAHADWGWKEVSATLAPGLYRLDLADALFASGAWYAVVSVAITSGLAAVTPKAFRLIARNDLTDTAQTGDGYAIVSSGTHGNAALKTLIDAVDDLIDSEVAAIKSDTAAILVDTGTDGVIVASIAANAITATAIAADAITAAKVADGTIDAATFATGAITAAAIASDAITDAKVAADVTIASVTGAVGSVTGAVGSIASGGITAASFGANAIAAAALDPDVTTELQSGLATAAALDTVDNLLDTELPALTAAVQGLMLASGTIGATGNDTTHLHLSGLAYADDGINSLLLTIKDVSTGLFYARWVEDFANTGDLATVATLPFTPEASVDLYWILPTRADVTGGSGLDAAGVRAAVGLASANLDTQLGDLPTNAELATSQASADDATLVAIAALNNLSAAQVNTEVDTALADINLDHLVKIAVDTNFAATVHADSVLGQVADNGAGFDRTTDSLEAIRDRGDAAWTTATGFSTLSQADVRTAVGLASANLDTQIGDLPTNAELATSQAAADDATLAAIAALNNLSQANVRTAVGLGSANLDTQLDALPTAVENADALLGRTIAGGANGGRMVKDALRFNRNKFTISGGTLTVYEEDDTTIAWTAVITQTAGNPVSASDPA